MCAKLNKSLYGTRDAALNWAHAYSEVLEKIGFTKDRSSPCCFYHAKWGVRTVVHGDDFHIVATRPQLEWLHKEMAKHWEIVVRGILSPNGETGTAITHHCFEQLITWTPLGIQTEADPRHVTLIVRELDVQAKLKTPMVYVSASQADDDEEEDVDAARAVKCRSCVM